MRSSYDDFAELALTIVLGLLLLLLAVGLLGSTVLLGIWFVQQIGAL